jgi:DNA-binding GntR family transcriptional regulator
MYEITISMRSTQEDQMQDDPESQDSSIEIVQQPSLVEQARDRLLGAIIRGELQPGERLSEVEMARRMGISRGPVREAARLLEQRGFLRSEPRRGFFVRAVTVEDIKNLHEVRSCISVYAARSAKENAKPEEIRKIRDLYNDVCAVATGRDNPLAPLEASYALQRQIFHMTDNPRFVEFFENIIWEGRQVATLVNIGDARSGAYYVETLLPLVKAFEFGTPDEVGEAMKEYLRVNFEDLIEYYRQHPGTIAGA